MLFRRVLFCAALLLGGALSAPAQEVDEAADVLKLQTAGLPTDGPGLLAFFRQRTRESVAPDKLKELIGKLGDKDKDERARAARELVGLGPLAVPSLRLAVSDPDSAEASALARRCLAAVQGEGAAELTAVAARTLALRRPKGTVEALLTYLPFADSDETLDEVRHALAEGSSGPDGKADPALVKALADDLPLRRAVALDVLAARGDAPPASLRKLLGDAKASVRLRAALALAAQKDAKAVSTLVVLLGELPFNQAREAEDFLLNLAGDQAPKAPVGPEAESRQKARDAWAEWWLKSEKPGLLEEFRKRTMDDEARDKALALIRDLGNENFKVRDAATDKLKEMGVLVLPLLRKAIKEQKDVEIQNRAKELVTAIEKIEKGPLSPVAARLVGYRKPEGAVQALLRYLPFADDDNVLAEVQGALNALAYKDGKADPLLLAALADKRPLLRAVAAEALVQGASDKELAEVRKLLKDADPKVRLQTALALAGQRDREAVPVLINLVGDSADQATPAEEFLTRLAGEDAPIGDAGTDETARGKRKEAWAKWWKEKGDKVRMLSLRELPRRQRLLGLTLLICPNNAMVAELGQDGKIRWQFSANNPWDAQVIGRDRLFLLESGLRRVAERNLRGEVLWQMNYNNIWPVGAQRLPNGNIFLTSGNCLVEMTRNGREVLRYNRPQGDIYAARKFKNGQIIYVTNSGIVQRLSGTGKEIKSWHIPNPTNQGIHILDNGNVVYPQQHTNRVYEYNPNGRQVWTATATQPAAVWRLPNGHTLISSAWPNQVVEVDRAGKEVWKATTTMQALRVYRR
jgi:HEAT repeat protein